MVRHLTFDIPSIQTLKTNNWIFRLSSHHAIECHKYSFACPECRHYVLGSINRSISTSSVPCHSTNRVRCVVWAIFIHLLFVRWQKYVSIPRRIHIQLVNWSIFIFALFFISSQTWQPVHLQCIGLVAARQSHDHNVRHIGVGAVRAHVPIHGVQIASVRSAAILQHRFDSANDCIQDAINQFTSIENFYGVCRRNQRSVQK